MLGGHRADHLLEMMADSWAVEGSEGRRYLKWVLRKESCQDQKMRGSAN